MFAGIAILLACQAVGEWLSAALHIPVPGPVLGMALLAALLAGSRRMPSRDGEAGLRPAEPERGKVWKPAQGFHINGLAQVADGLLKAMPLFFIPAGVGVMILSDTLRGAWLPITVALFVSTLLAIMATAVVMRATLRLLSRRTRRNSR